MITKEEIENINRLRAEGKTYRTISVLTGKSVGTCWEYTHPISNDICMVVEPTLLTRLNEWVRKTIRR